VSDKPAPTQLLHIRAAIHDCINRYAMLFDTGQFDELAQLFTPDAVFDVSPAPKFMGVPLEGRGEIIENLARRYTEVAARGDRHQHVCTNTVFDELLENRCVTRTYLTSVAAGTTASAHVATFGTYHDVFRLEGDRWMFAERRLLTSTEIP
jgi:hypothetical protein